ncbi:M20 family metallopeptidase [Brevibacillus ruminantium]|uniref:M20 family metallopeptidase n=1 Tax=Brevibacillus ruminantium TaxID=2950604 RepID=A0ABY4WBS0_9BACL|nr:M20 family metallopeptidase [Brevibacillus ruminantium]USG64503.1 M20 family metallopeptidase [Brevibacillus ruminantium]
MKIDPQAIWKQAQAILPWVTEVRRDFHQYPEFGMEEFRTRDQIIHYLEEMDIPYQVVAGTGVVGLIEGHRPGAVVALRGDIDALPIEEENDVPYRSKVPGKMHACGHDAHTTVLLGAAKLLQEQRAKISGVIKLFFQPAEETVGGAVPMIEAGVMENPRVDAVFGLHVAPELPAGQIAVKYGQVNAASDTLNILVKGENGHGAYPHKGRDAIVIAAHVITALQTIVSRNVDPREAAVVTLGVIQGGTQGNILAREVKLTGTIRTMNRHTRTLVKERVREVAELTARSLGGEAIVSLEEGYTALINDNRMVDLVKQCGEELLGKEHVSVLEAASMGVEDFAFFAEQAPAAFFQLGCRNDQTGCVYPLHHPRFNLDESCLAVGVAMQVYNALSFLQAQAEASLLESNPV